MIIRRVTEHINFNFYLFSEFNLTLSSCRNLLLLRPSIKKTRKTAKIKQIFYKDSRGDRLLRTKKLPHKKWK